ncbi:hypothetical protein B1J92_C04169g [Nakaseomyces glabratus]|nr:hypothetical protein LTX96_0002926 [Nakaseomyces glabratus]OXB44989.1 hypothetical protein B1J91_C04169g [Nakaseomyces glabratus]OXB50286.1 hypothetical protein B1J92_C04169g [Nakaseomyces glabratus]
MPLLSGKPSPLERVGGDYFKESFRLSNHSALSLESTQTAERLLDRLELSDGDEQLIKQAMEADDKVRVENTQSGPVVCLPANAFPSLRSSRIHQRHGSESTMRDTLGLEKASMSASVGEPLRGNTCATAVERHIPEHYRYSYIVEEDTDIESLLSMSTTENTSTEQQKNRHHFHNLMAKTNDTKYHFPRKETALRTESNNVRSNAREKEKNALNFERYRIDNSKLMTDFPHLANKQRKLHYYHELLAKPQNGVRTDKDRQKSNDSQQSIEGKHQDSSNLYKPKTSSSGESMLSDRRDKYPPTPKKSSSNSTLDLSMDTELSQPPTPSYKDHQKKSSLSSLKSFFKSPKSYKSKNRSEDKLDATSTNPKSKKFSHMSSNDSLTKSFKIYPSSRPSKKEEYTYPNKTQKDYISTPIRKPSHNRSYSDYSTIKSLQKGMTDADNSLKTLRLQNLLGKPPMRQLTHRRAKSDDFLSIASHSDSAVNENLHTYASSYAQYDRLTSSHNLDQASALINEALSLRSQEKYYEASKKLQQACIEGSKTAYLLYGIALRKGEGVKCNYTESLRYLNRATGIHNCNEFVMRCNIDPLTLEKSGSIPIIPPQPLAPALYECGLSYLKGYGVPSANSPLGLKYLEYAGSLGHVDAMCLSGIILSKNKDKSPEDVIRAASWFRIAEKRGANLIGSEWIHKQDYQM